MTASATPFATTDRDEIARFLERYYSEMETNDPARYSEYYADAIRLVFGNEQPILGRDAVTAAFAEVLGRVTSLHHDLVNVWPQPGGVVIFESVGTWNLRDGRSVSIPAASVFTVQHGLFTDLRIYVDNAPLFAALREESAG